MPRTANSVIPVIVPMVQRANPKAAARSAAAPSTADANKTGTRRAQGLMPMTRTRVLAVTAPRNQRSRRWP